jgi:SAM-dependent methyltransferase
VEDLAFLDQTVQEWSEAHGAPRVLVLGVTPEIAGLAWPTGTKLLAVDRCPAMIRDVWPGFPSPGAGALCADWLKMPLERESRDLVFGDGSFGVLRFPDLARELMEAVRKVMRPQALFVTRVFIRPALVEDPESVFADLRAGRIGNFQIFKFRLAMALHQDTRRGVRVGEIWDYWDKKGRPAELATARGWAPEQIASIEAYRDKNSIYYFPTFSEIRRLLQEMFARVRVRFPSYELGERCPTFTCMRYDRPSQEVRAARRRREELGTPRLKVFGTDQFKRQRK